MRACRDRRSENAIIRDRRGRFISGLSSDRHELYRFFFFSLGRPAANGRFRALVYIYIYIQSVPYSRIDKQIVFFFSLSLSRRAAEYFSFFNRFITTYQYPEDVKGKFKKIYAPSPPPAAAAAAAAITCPPPRTVTATDAATVSRTVADRRPLAAGSSQNVRLDDVRGITGFNRNHPGGLVLFKGTVGAKE